MLRGHERYMDMKESKSTSIMGSRRKMFRFRFFRCSNTVNADCDKVKEDQMYARYKGGSSTISHYQNIWETMRKWNSLKYLNCKIVQFLLSIILKGCHVLCIFECGIESGMNGDFFHLKFLELPENQMLIFLPGCIIFSTAYVYLTFVTAIYIRIKLGQIPVLYI